MIVVEYDTGSHIVYCTITITGSLDNGGLRPTVILINLITQVVVSPTSLIIVSTKTDFGK